MVKGGNPKPTHGFGSPFRTKEFDDAARAKIKGVPRKRKWSKDRCIIQLEDIMDILKKRATEDEDLKDLERVTNKMMDIIRYLYPPVHQSVNVNIDTTADVVLKRLENWKTKENENENEKVVVVK